MYEWYKKVFVMLVINLLYIETLIMDWSFLRAIIQSSFYLYVFQNFVRVIIFKANVILFVYFACVKSEKWKYTAMTKLAKEVTYIYTIDLTLNW